MSILEKIQDFDSQPLSTLIHTFVKWYGVDSIEMETAYRANVESGVWIRIKITMKDKTWYVDGQRLDIVKRRLQEWFNINLKQQS